MAYKISPLPPVYTAIGSVVFGETSVHAELSLTKRLNLTLMDADDNYASVSVSASEVDTLINFLRDMQKNMR
jgi:hypothetical protein